MKRSATLTLVLFVLGFALGAAIPCLAQVRTRWRLDFEHSKPRQAQVVNVRGEKENVWYVTYVVRNRSGEIIPIRLDLMLFADYGKDMQNDIKKVDIANVSRVLDDRANAEGALFGIFHPDVMESGIETQIITIEEKMGNRSEGIILESVEKLRAGNPTDEKLFPRYLNHRQLRLKRIIRPGESYGGLALFRGVDPRAKLLDLQVSGLEDFLKLEFRQGENNKKIQYYTFENKVYTSRYRFPGDEFERENDVLRFDQRGWRVKKIGPVAHKETLQKIVDTLVAALRKAKNPPAAPPPADAPVLDVSPTDLNSMAAIMTIATGKTFGWDPAKSVAENEEAVWTLHEWWINIESKLVYDVVKNRFVESPDKIPGQTSP